MVERDSSGDSRSYVGAERVRAEAVAYEAFCSRFDLVDSAEAVMLYLTARLSEGAASRHIRTRLQLLDNNRRLQGLNPWRQDPDVRTFLQGVFSIDPVGEKCSHYDPLYLGLVHAMVDACRVPTDDQRRALVARMLRDRMGLTVAAMARLRWSDVRIGNDRLSIQFTRKVGRGRAALSTRELAAEAGRATCPVAAMRAMRSVDGGEFVLGARGKPIDVNRLARTLDAEGHASTLPAQVRDPALLLVGYAAGLRTKETLKLRQGDVRTHDRGLAIAIQGRRRLTYLPSSPQQDYDPSNAWTAWLERLEAHGLRDPARLAFHATNFSVVFDKGLGEVGLNRMVHQRAEMACLTGRFSWTSLRSGMIRTALQNEVQQHVIAAHADLASLKSVQRHEHRERLLSARNIAGQLGL